MKLSLSCFLSIVLATVAYGAVNPSLAPTPVTAKEIAQGYRDHVILARPRAAHRATVDEEETREHVRVHQRFSRFGDLRVIALDDGDDAATAIARLKATGRYEFVEPDYIRYAQVAPNDTAYVNGSMWALNNTGQAGNVIGVAGADIKALAAWDIIHDAPNVVVAVVDTGINLSHQDIVGNLWTNASPTRNDLHGANFVNGNGAMVNGDPSDDEGHGTHVAGTIGAVGNNGTASVGIAWKVQLMAVKVLSASGSGSTSDIVAGINYAIAHGANIINASFGADSSTGYSQSEWAAINGARNSGVIFVAAAGNSSANLDVSRSYPASFALDNIVTVGASNRRDEISSFSNYGAAVDLFAPGEEIVSLDYATSAGTIAFNGTSMAAPHVSGAFALLKAEFPNDTYRQLINRLLRGVDRGSKFVGKAQTGGRLNLLRALSTTTNRPFNDDFADRPHYENDDNLTIRSNNTDATAEAADPTIAGFTPSTTLWWEWKAASSGNVSIDTNGSSYDTVLAVYTGSTAGSLTTVAENDNDATGVTSRLSFAAVAGTTYQIAIGGKNGAAGLTMLNLGTTPANDSFASPVVLTGQSTHLTGNNLHSSRELSEPVILGFGGGNSVWYQWTAPRSGTFQVSANSNDFDPIMAVYTGTTFSALTLVSASDNTGADNTQTAALCTINATAGTTYRITIDSKTASAAGQFTLSLTDSIWQSTTGGNVTGSPAVASDGTIYVGSTDKNFYAFNADGSQKWTVTTGGLIDTCSAAIASDGTVYFGSNDGYLYAVSSTGTTKWKHPFAQGTAVAAAYSPALAADGTIYARASDGYLHALSPTDGSELWKQSINTSASTFYGNPVVGSDGTIYQGSDENDHKLYAWKPDGTSRWPAPINLDSGVYGAPAIDASGNLYVVTLTGGAYSFTAAGTRRWYETSNTSVSSSVALSGDGSTMYYAGYDALLYARDTATGTIKWQCRLGAEVRASSPAIDANGVIYIGCYDDSVFAVNPNGTVNRTYDTGNIVRSAPVIFGRRLYFGSNDQKLYAFDLPAGVDDGPWPQFRANPRRLGRNVANAVSILAQPVPQTASVGSSFRATVTTASQETLTYQWKKNGVAIPGASDGILTIQSVTPSDAGSYTVVASNSSGALMSNSAELSVINPLGPTAWLTNLSVRTTFVAGQNPLIVGVTVRGGSKNILMRVAGPALGTLLNMSSGYVADPRLDLTILGEATPIASNDNWDSSLATTFAALGAFGFPAGSKDAALSETLDDKHNYTVQVPATSAGLVIVEAYDVNWSSNALRMVNLSARNRVGTGTDVLIAGFHIAGTGTKKLLVRAVGPTIGAAPFNVPGVLADPMLEVHHTDANGSDVILATNNDWNSSLLADFDKVGAFHLNDGSKDAAAVVTLDAGTNYTVLVKGANGGTGEAIVEVYELP